MRKLVTISFLFTSITAISQTVTNTSAHSTDVQQRVNAIIERYNKVEERGTTYDRENPPSRNWGGLVRTGAYLLNILGDIGDRSALPFLEELALSTNTYDFARERAASAYIKVAELEESVYFLRNMYQVNTNKTGHWRYMLNEQIIDKYESKKAISSVRPQNEINFFNFLIEQVLDPGSATQANQIDNFLIANLHGYSNSIQRTIIAKKYANSGNEWRTNTFNPIKSHFDNLPKSQLVDLREQFPDLPPLPEELIENNKQYKSIVMVGSAVGIFLILGVFFIRYYRKNVP